MPRYKFQRTETTTESEIRALILAPDETWFGPLIAFLYIFGCRISEAVNLKRRNIWIEGDNLVAQIGVLKRRDTKKGPYANVPHLLHANLDTPFVREILLPYLDTIKDRESWLFPSSESLKHISRVSAWKHLKEKMKEISPHVFRHDRLMKLALKGATESQLMDWAGWTDSRPASTYIRATGRLAAQLSDKVD